MRIFTFLFIQFFCSGCDKEADQFSIIGNYKLVSIERIKPTYQQITNDYFIHANFNFGNDLQLTVQKGQDLWTGTYDIKETVTHVYDDVLEVSKDEVSRSFRLHLKQNNTNQYYQLELEQMTLSGNSTRLKGVTQHGFTQLLYKFDKN